MKQFSERNRANLALKVNVGGPADPLLSQIARFNTRWQTQVTETTTRFIFVSRDQGTIIRACEKSANNQYYRRLT